ncbi:MAG: hypothetical protein ABIR80_00660, partial [Opitutaceae bacterium]
MIVFSRLPQRVAVVLQRAAVRSAFYAAGCGALMAGSVAFGAASGVAPPGIAPYKKLSLAQLMDIEVTSVSRRPENLGEAASAVQVVTGDDIRRAGPLRIPTALRLLSNL